MTILSLALKSRAAEIADCLRPADHRAVDAFSFAPGSHASASFAARRCLWGGRQSAGDWITRSLTITYEVRRWRWLCPRSDTSSQACIAPVMSA